MNISRTLPASFRPAPKKKPALEAGFPPPNLVAIADKRYINRYHYNATTDAWVVIVDAQHVDGISHWAVRVVDEDGRPIGQLQKHTLDIWANRFADHPFDVTRADLIWKRPLYDTFKQTFCTDVDDAKARELFDSYLARLSYCSAFDALVRLGLRQP